jgi:hypothetical protein
LTFSAIRWSYWTQNQTAADHLRDLGIAVEFENGVQHCPVSLGMEDREHQAGAAVEPYGSPKVAGRGDVRFCGHADTLRYSLCFLSFR